MAYPYYQQQMYPQQMMQVQQPQPQQQMQIQNGGFMVVPNEEVVRTYPVAPGSCVTFKIEGKPVVMEKSMGFSQFESPRIEKYKLIHEEDTPVTTQKAQIEEKQTSMENETIEELKGEIKAIWDEINGMKSKRTTKKKEVDDDDTE